MQLLPIADGTAQPGLGMLREQGHAFLEEAGQNKIICRTAIDVIALRQSESAIDRVIRSHILLVAIGVNMRMFTSVFQDDLPTVVGRAIINHDDLIRTALDRKSTRLNSS